MTIQMQRHFFAIVFSLIITSLLSVTVSLAQLSPVQAPTTAAPAPPLPQPTPTLASPPATVPAAAAPAAAPGMGTVPLVPTSPSVAPTRAIPKAPTIDIVQILRKAKRFSVLIRLLKTTQLINQFNSQLMTSGSGGLTIFAPEDAAFGKLKAGFLNSLSDRQKVELLQFHTMSSFVSISNFDTLTNPVQTQAGDDPARLQLNVTSYGRSQISMTTGAVNASITGTVYTDNKLAIYQVDKVLLPLDFVLPKATAPAPALAATKGDSLKSDKNKASANANGSGDGDGSDGGDDNNVPVDSSKGSLSFDVGMKCVLQVLGGAVVATVMT